MAATEKAVEQVVDNTLQDAMAAALSNLKGTFQFSRKINLQNRGLDYENVEAACFVQFDYPTDLMDASPEAAEAWLALSRQAANYAAAVVYERLGIEAVKEGDVLREVFKEFPGAVVTEGALKGDDRPVQGVTASKNPPYTQAEVKNMGGAEMKAARKENSTWAAARYESHPQEFFDNRSKKANDPSWSTSPDFTHKDSRVGFWVD